MSNLDSRRNAFLCSGHVWEGRALIESKWTDRRPEIISKNERDNSDVKVLSQQDIHRLVTITLSMKLMNFTKNFKKWQTKFWYFLGQMIWICSTKTNPIWIRKANASHHRVQVWPNRDEYKIKRTRCGFVVKHVKIILGWIWSCFSLWNTTKSNLRDEYVRA